jgi:hypothetical protein
VIRHVLCLHCLRNRVKGYDILQGLQEPASCKLENCRLET